VSRKKDIHTRWVMSFSNVWICREKNDKPTRFFMSLFQSSRHVAIKTTYLLDNLCRFFKSRSYVVFNRDKPKFWENSNRYVAIKNDINSDNYVAESKNDILDKLVVFEIEYLCREKKRNTFLLYFLAISIVLRQDII
jgi:hypothetical protein